MRPPNSPWIPLQEGNAGKSVLSFYHSDSKSKVPVRDITTNMDSKSDPNIETKTYGLFSTCEQKMRAGVVGEGIKYIFFCTKRERTRVLTGYYRIGWYHKGPPIPYKGGGDDYQLAAEECRFVNPGFRLQDLSRLLHPVHLDKFFRTFRYIDDKTAQKLLSLLKRSPDATEQYLHEIPRLEQLNIEKYGFAYTNWKRLEGFTWETARKYMGIDT